MASSLIRETKGFEIQTSDTHSSTKKGLVISDLTTSEKMTTLRPPLHIGPISVFLLILSGLKFQVKEKILLLTSFTNSAGTFNTEQL